MLKNKKIRRLFSVYTAAVLFTTIGALPVLADGDPLTVVNNLSNFIFTLIRAVGMIFAGYGILQIGLSFKSQDPHQRSQGIMAAIGGIIVIFTKEILNTIIG